MLGFRQTLRTGTYAKVVKLTPPIQNVTKLASGQSVGAENVSVEPSDSKYTGQKRGKNRNGTGMENVTSKSTCHQQLKTSTKIMSMEKKWNRKETETIGSASCGYPT